MVDKKISVHNWIKTVHKAKEKLKVSHAQYAERAESHYFNDVKKNGSNLRVEVPVFWSNTQVMRSALFSQNPAPEVRRRNSGDDPTPKLVAECLEKAIAYQIDQSDFHSDVKRSVLDYLLVDMGVLRCVYDAKIGQATGEDGQPYEEIISQSIVPDHIPWNRFLYDIGKDWAECEWVAYIHYITKDEIKKQFGKDVSQMAAEADQLKVDKANKITVYEIWDKRTRTIFEIMEGEKEPLRVRQDELNLEQFFDCTKPMISNMRTDKFIPYPDFMMIEPQLNAVNMLEARIKVLTRSIRDVGFHDSSLTKLKELQNAADGTLVPITDLIKKMEGRTDMSAVVVKLDIDKAAIVIQILSQQKEANKEEIYEITGISDIVRGNTKASETATAQQLKGQWANVRLQEKQNTINGMLRQLMRMYSEVIAEHFQPEILSLMTGVEVTPEMTQIMKGDLSRNFSIDVETDSTIAADEQQDKQDRNEMLQSVTGYLQVVLPLKQQGLIDADVARELLLVNVRGYKHAKNLEDIVLAMEGTDEQLQQLQQQLQEMGQQAEQMQMQGQQQMEQLDQQLQQAGGEIERLNQVIGEFNQQDEQRKDIEVHSEAKKDDAQAAKNYAEAEKTQAETRTIGMPQVEVHLQ